MVLPSALLTALPLLGPAGEEGWLSPSLALGLVLVLGVVVAALERWRLARVFARQAQLEEAVAAAVRDLAAANRELQARNEALRRLNEVKSEFLGAAAHDLKNPLGVVMGLSEIILEQLEEARPRDPALAAGIAERAALIRSSAEHMSVLVGQLLDTVALESGQVVLRRQEVDLSRLAAGVAEAHRSRARVKGIELVLEAGVDCRGTVDPDRAWEILDNLVGNAVKFSPPGRRVWVGAGSGAEGSVRLEVRDEGPGLTPEDHARVFGRFQRLSARPTAGEPSNGLGLSIVKMLAELHGGAVRVESEAGRGARFVVELPPGPPPA